MKEKQEEQKLVCADKKVIERVLGPRVSQPRQILSPRISLYFPGEFRNIEPKKHQFTSPPPLQCTFNRYLCVVSAEHIYKKVYVCCSHQNMSDNPRYNIQISADPIQSPRQPPCVWAWLQVSDQIHSTTIVTPLWTNVPVIRTSIVLSSTPWDLGHSGEHLQGLPYNRCLQLLVLDPHCHCVMGIEINLKISTLLPC